ncbi:hypothetical protein [Fodinicola feengrottensis]|nr:hypothetical protein [Fodinicola feengrottensis]
MCGAITPLTSQYSYPCAAVATTADDTVVAARREVPEVDAGQCAAGDFR